MIYISFSTTLVWMTQLGWFNSSPRQYDSMASSDLKQRQQLITFTKQFGREYFFWTQGKSDLRESRLTKFGYQDTMAKDLFDVNSIEWDSYARHVDVWDISKRPSSDNIEEVTLVAETLLTRSNADGENDQKRVDRWVVIPVQLTNGTYRVIDVPKLIPEPS